MSILTHRKYSNKICSVGSFTLYLWSYNEKHNYFVTKTMYTVSVGYLVSLYSHLYYILLVFVTADASF